MEDGAFLRMGHKTTHKWGPEIRKLGHVTPATPTYGSFYGPYAGRLHSLCLYQN